MFFCSYVLGVQNSYQLNWPKKTGWDLVSTCSFLVMSTPAKQLEKFNRLTAGDDIFSDEINPGGNDFASISST